MFKFQISDETRHFVDAILHTFTYPRKINDIRGAVRQALKAENGDASEGNIDRLYSLIISFLSKYEFGHEEDYVYLIDKRGMELKESGSLAAFETKVWNSIHGNTV